MNQQLYHIIQNQPLRIAVSGQSGCGNTTVSTMLAQRLNITCINYTFRNLAKELNIPLTVVIERAKMDFHFDKLVDERQIELARKGACVLGSRLAIWLLEEACLKVYLTASAETRVRRIHRREGGSIEAIRNFTAMRDADDTRRYKMLYDIDNTSFQFADMCIDTELYDPELITAIIIDELIRRKLIEQIV